MRPSISEQLEGLRRILEEVVAPGLSDPYPRDILAGVCATLESIAEGWQQVPAFLEWDTRASAAVLDAVAAAGLDAVPIFDAVPTRAVSPDPYDIPALEERHRQARAALANVVPVIAGHDNFRALRMQLTAHLRERGQRYPLKTVWRPPANSTPSSRPEQKC